MQDTVIETGATVEYAITDKNVKITSYKELKERSPSRYLSKNANKFN